MEIQIKKSFDCDVLVIGGVAGFGAAMGAAKNGAKVILAEEKGVFRIVPGQIHILQYR